MISTIYPMISLTCFYLQVYTLKIFKYFQRQFRKGLETTAVESVTIGDKILYDVYPDDDPEDINGVLFIRHPSGDIEVSCKCRHFEEVGWLCQHCLRVMDKNNIKRIPEKYILQRWTRTSKARVWDRVVHTNNTNKNAQV